MKKIKHAFIFGFLLFLLLLNIFYSQTISPLYFQLTKDNRNAVVDFLRKTKNLPSFRSILEMQKEIYGNSFEHEVLADTEKRKQLIVEYEQLLEKNPKARDVLYNLYLLYNQGGNRVRAEEYLRKAKEIDPILK